MNLPTQGICALLALASLTFAQSSTPKLPCGFSGELLRDAQGKVIRFASDEMKRRATNKADISDSMKRTDIKGTVVVDVLISASGEIVCMKSLIGHPIIRTEVEKALRLWAFKPAEVGGKSMAYLGELEFTLCNINCGKEGLSMTILK